MYIIQIIKKYTFIGDNVSKLFVMVVKVCYLLA